MRPDYATHIERDEPSAPRGVAMADAMNTPISAGSQDCSLNPIDRAVGASQSVRTLWRNCKLCLARFEINPRHVQTHEFCSGVCRARWHREHPTEARQRPLDFAGPAAPTVGTPAHAEQRAALDKRESKKDRLLALLRRGPARTWDCMLAGGSGWRSRLQELREEGHRISTEEHPDFAIYTLEVNS